jgi:hypothetical protein
VQPVKAETIDLIKKCLFPLSLWRFSYAKEEKDRVMLAELEKRYDTFIKSEEVQNYLTARDFQNKFTKAKQEGKKVEFWKMSNV